MKPVIQNITTTITASLSNTALFGSYAVDFLFNISHDSPIYTAYTMILKEKIDVSVELKEKDTKAFILREICQILKPAIQKQPYMYDSFVIGNLHQISRETYTIYFTHFSDRYGNELQGSVYNKSKKGDFESFIGAKDTAIVILEKGPNIFICKKYILR